jgi:DNA-binding MarR family transcriptional regulator
VVGSVTQINIEDARWLDRACHLLMEFRKHNSDITANQVLVFLMIAARPGISQKEIGEEIGLDSGSMARIAALLSDRGLPAQDRAGMDLIRIDLVPGDYRKKGLFLSKKGRAVLTTLRNFMAGK